MLAWIILGILLLVVLGGIGIYNQLVRARNAVANRFADIDVVLTKRYDLIPNLVEVAKKYMRHEEETLTKVIQARNGAADALQQAGKGADIPGLAALSQADNALTRALGGLNVVFEAYPELKADAQMRQLQDDIAQMESQIMLARSAYNDSVTQYNNLIQAFPNNLFANMFAFRDAAWLEIESAEKRAAVKVDFS